MISLARISRISILERESKKNKFYFIKKALIIQNTYRESVMKMANCKIVNAINTIKGVGFLKKQL